MSDCKRCVELEAALRFYADAASEDPLWDSTHWDDGERARAALSAPAQPATANNGEGFGWSPSCDVPSGSPCACGATHVVSTAPPSTAAHRTCSCGYMNAGIVCTKCGKPSPAAREATKELNEYQRANLRWLLQGCKRNFPRLDTGDWFGELLLMTDGVDVYPNANADAFDQAVNGISSNRDQALRAVVDTARDLMANLRVERRKGYVTDSRFVIPLANALAELCLPGTAESLAALDAAREGK